MTDIRLFQAKISASTHAQRVGWTVRKAIQVLMSKNFRPYATRQTTHSWVSHVLGHRPSVDCMCSKQGLSIIYGINVPFIVVCNLFGEGIRRIPIQFLFRCKR